MTRATCIPRTEGRIIPWGNGLETSREIILEQTTPQQESPKLLWRLATTRIEADCPFSRYAGQDRIIVLLKGNGFELSHESANTQAVTAPSVRSILAVIGAHTAGSSTGR